DRTPDILRVTKMQHHQLLLCACLAIAPHYAAGADDTQQKCAATAYPRLAPTHRCSGRPTYLLGSPAETAQSCPRILCQSREAPPQRTASTYGCGPADPG